LSEKGTSSLPDGTTVSADDVTMHLPVSSRDFTDFSCSKDHVLNAGEAIQGKRYLPPGFLYFPIGYSGRTSSLVVSGTPVVRPKGQYKNADGNVEHGPTQRLDYELEMACIVGKPSELGKPVAIKDADEHIFGIVIVNDWSGKSTVQVQSYVNDIDFSIARDIQGFEMPPLGPLNGKSFGTSVSPWIITLDALKESAIKGITREIPVASYLSDPNPVNSYDIRLKVELLTNDKSTTICETNLSSMYWSFRDMIVHQTSNGCSVRTGDLLATGTISGSTHESHGCLLELTKGGQKSFAVGEGAERVYLEDGDAVRISALASEGVGFGECTGKILPAV
jgi:fumarylacetoacetase